MKEARDLILELYKDDHITKQEAEILLDAIYSYKHNPLIRQEQAEKIQYIEPYKQPYTTEPYKWDITCNNE